MSRKELCFSLISNSLIEDDREIKGTRGNASP